MGDFKAHRTIGNLVIKTHLKNIFKMISFCKSYVLFIIQLTCAHADPFLVAHFPACTFCSTGQYDCGRNFTIHRTRRLLKSREILRDQNKHI